MSSADFLERLTANIRAEMHNPQFGVGDLAELMSMSRSSLLRQVKKSGPTSINQLIKDTRLERSKELLETTDLNVSQISFEVGFSSPSYFIKCFREAYGFPPGSYEQEEQPREEVHTQMTDGVNWAKLSGWSALGLIIIASFWFFLRKPITETHQIPSIAVLPFINESQDSTQLYLVNGMMGSILSNLQRLGDLRVISRTSVEQFRGSKQSISEIADQLNVEYVVEGSVQLYQQEMLLSVQLIDGDGDDQLWSEQYRRNLSDIFNLQAEVSGKIAEAIQVVVTPDVLDEILKMPTENQQAYQAYLLGVEWASMETDPGLDSAIGYFKNAIELDPQFANAHAYLAVCYYYKDIFKVEKDYADELARHADLAVLLDGKEPVCLISKALQYMQLNQYADALVFFEKVVEYAPNSATAHNYLAEIYTSYLPDLEKYLIHVLTASKLDLSGNDSTSLSYTHLHLANAYAQSGIIGRAKEHIHQSLAFKPDNLFSKTLEIYIDLSEDMDWQNAHNRMRLVYQKDTNRIDVLQEMAKISYTMENYSEAMHYYGKLLEVKTSYGLNLYTEEDVLIAYVYRKMDQMDIADSLITGFNERLETDETIYLPLHQALSAIYHGRYDEAIQDMDEFNKKDDFMYWVPAFLASDPLFREMADHGEYDRVLNDLKQNFEEDKLKRIEKLKALDLL